MQMSAGPPHAQANMRQVSLMECALSHSPRHTSAATDVSGVTRWRLYVRATCFHLLPFQHGRRKIGFLLQRSAQLAEVFHTWNLSSTELPDMVIDKLGIE